MAAGPSWQPNYVDLSDDRVLRFGGECVVCGAHYVTAPEALEVAIPPGREPDPATSQQIEEQKFQFFNDFDAAFQSIAIPCYYCGRHACPDCWDQDKEMCGACVVERGMPRSPYRGGPIEGPLADGFLRRAEPGRYAEVGRPDWLKQLLRAQSDPDAARAARLTAPPKQPPSAAGNRGRQAPQPPYPDPNESVYLRAPMLPPNPDQFEPPPTTKMDASSPRPRTPQRNDVAHNPEGEAMPAVVECPRCHAANYDFVTQCSECGLQLIQICMSCDKLNPGHVQTCQFCGELIQRPQGWTSVMQPIVALAPDEARKRMTGMPAPSGTISAGPQVRRPGNWADEDENPDEHRAWPGGRRPRPRQRATPVGAPAAAPIAVAQHAYTSNAIVTASHPYESHGPTLQPVMEPVELGGPSSQLPSHAEAVANVLASLMERLLSIILLVALFAVVGAIAAAESSAQANQALAGYLHFNIREQISHLLTLLHLNAPR